jgi:hypothetical protein
MSHHPFPLLNEEESRLHDGARSALECGSASYRLSGWISRRQLRCRTPRRLRRNDFQSYSRFIHSFRGLGAHEGRPYDSVPYFNDVLSFGQTLK